MDKKNKVNEFNIFGLTIQIILTVSVVILAILSLVVSHKFFLALEILVALDMFVMAYNNKKVYQRNSMTYCYIVVGIFLLIYALLTFLGVI